MTSALNTQFGQSTRLVLLSILAACLVAGCTSALSPETQPRDSYPGEWPEFVGAGPDCRRIEGTFENKGEVVDSRKIFEPLWRSHWEVKRNEGWLTDMFGKPLNPHVRESATVTALRGCDRVSLTVEPYQHEFGGLIPMKLDRLRIVITGSGPKVDEPAGRSESCPSLKIDLNYCKDGVLRGGYAETLMVGVAADGSLVARRAAFQSNTIYEEEIHRAVGRFRRVP